MKQSMLTSISNLIFAHLTVLCSSTAAVGLQNRGWVLYLEAAKGYKAAVPNVWVAKGQKMGSAKMVQICQNELFLSFFKFFQFRHRLNCYIIRMSFGFVLLKFGYCIVSGFPRVLKSPRI